MTFLCLSLFSNCISLESKQSQNYCGKLNTPNTLTFMKLLRVDMNLSYMKVFFISRYKKSALSIKYLNIPQKGTSDFSCLYTPFVHLLNESFVINENI